MVGLRNFICSCVNILGTSFVPVGTQFVPDCPSLDFHLNNYYFLGMNTHHAYPMPPDSKMSIEDVQRLHEESRNYEPFDFSVVDPARLGVPLLRDGDMLRFWVKAIYNMVAYGGAFIEVVWNGVSWPRLQPSSMLRSYF